MHIEKRTLMTANNPLRSRCLPEDKAKFLTKDFDFEGSSMAASPSHINFSEMDLPRNGLLLVDEQQMMDIVEPHHNDVLCGRGVTTNRHPGNESFRRLVSLNKELYVTSTKRQKMAISRSIVEAVRSLDPPGRFLDKDPVSGRWAEVGHKKAVEKTSQALRDGAASLRKQLSADLGDPDFLSAVFHAEEDDGSDKPEKTENDKKGKENELVDDSADVEIEKEKEKIDDDKLSSIKEKAKATAKMKLPKPKEVPVKVKKGHRRTRSTPIIGSVTAAKRALKKAPPTEPPPSPLVRMSENFVHEPPSPHSPQPRHSASHPNSPMTWGGRITFSEGHSPGSLGSIPRHSPYEPPPSPHAYSPYSHPPGQYRGSHGFEYHGTHREHPPYQWRKKPTRYEHYPGHPSPTYPPPGPPRPPPAAHSSPAPHSPLPSGPLPPGRHKFSPSGYQSNPHPLEYHRSDHPPPAEWSPRVVQRHHSRYPSPRHYSPHYGDYQGAQSPRWRPSSSQESYSSGEYSSPPLPNSSLSVPALGGEGKPSHGVLSPRASPRVMLTPRSRHSSYSQIPPRPPSYPHKEFMPPSQPSFSSDDFSPPPPPRYRHSSSGYYRPHSASPEDRTRPMRSSPVEEKKTDADEQEHMAIYSPEKPRSMPLGSVSNTQEMEYSPHSTAEMEGKKTGFGGDYATSDDYSRESGSYARDVAGADDPALDTSVDDIQMSPIPFDREDPSTLMELPENIMILPISPCGPKDT